MAMKLSRFFAIFAILAAAIAAQGQQNLSLMSLDGTSVALSSLQGKVVVLMFAGIQDPQSREEFKALDTLVQRYRDKDAVIYWVSINPASAASDERLRAQRGASSVAILRDPNQSVFKHFGGLQLPTAVILDRKGQVQGKPRGGFNPNADFVNDLATTVDSLLTSR